MLREGRGRARWFRNADVRVLETKKMASRRVEEWRYAEALRYVVDGSDGSRGIDWYGGFETMVVDEDDYLLLRERQGTGMRHCGS